MKTIEIFDLMKNAVWMYHMCSRDEMALHPNRDKARTEYRRMAYARMLQLKREAERIVLEDRHIQETATDDEKKRLINVMLKSWLILADWPAVWRVE